MALPVCVDTISHTTILTPEMRGLQKLRLAPNATLAIGRDTGCGITSMQVSRKQCQLQRGASGTFELMNTGIGMVRVVRPPARTAPKLKEKEKVTVHNGDLIQILVVHRECGCPLAGTCQCSAGSGDKIAVIASWKARQLVSIRRLLPSLLLSLLLALLAHPEVGGSTPRCAGDKHPPRARA